MASEAEKRAAAMQGGGSRGINQALGRNPGVGQGVGSDLARQIQARGLNAPDAEADAEDPFVLTKRGNFRQRGVAAGSTLGEQRRLSDMEKGFFKMSKGDLSKLQKRLEAGGFYQGAYQVGVHDEATLAAYSIALKRAVNFGMAGNEVTLDEVIDSGAGSPTGGESTEAEAFMPLISNSEQLRETVRKVSTLVAGQYLPDNVVDGIVTQFQQQEINAQRQKYDLAINNEVGVTEEAPTAEFSIEKKVRDVDPVGAGAFDLSERAKVLSEMLGGLQ